MNFSNSDRSDVSDVSWVKKKKKESTRDKSWPKLHTVVTSYRAHVAEHESRMVQKREEDKSIDHRERSKSPPRIPTISLSGHSLPRGPTGWVQTAMVKEKADSPDKDAETKGGRGGGGGERESNRTDWENVCLVIIRFQLDNYTEHQHTGRNSKWAGGYV